MKQDDGWGERRPPAVTPNKRVQIASYVIRKGFGLEFYWPAQRFLDGK